MKISPPKINRNLELTAFKKQIWTLMKLSKKLRNKQK